MLIVARISDSINISRETLKLGSAESAKLDASPVKLNTASPAIPHTSLSRLLQEQ